MSNDILGSLVRALVTVPVDRLGLVQDFARKLADPSGEQWFEQGKLFLRKESCWTNGQDPQVTQSNPTPSILEPEVEADSIIRVDLSIRPSYPDWVKEVVHPELEDIGPAEYDISAVEQWLHDGQKGGKWIEGTKIWAELNKPEILKDHLGLRDLEEIQKKGIAFFRKYFKGKGVFGWKSVVRRRFDHLHVSFLCEGCGKVILSWYSIEQVLYGDNPALHFASSAKA